MDMMRAVLGDEQLNYLGYSYGTFLGATYAKLFPEKVGRLVLDGAIDPSMSGTGRRHHAGRRLRVGAARVHGRLPARRRVPVPRHASTRRWPTSARCSRASTAIPIRGADGRMLGADSLMTAIVSALYSQESWTLPHDRAHRGRCRATPTSRSSSPTSTTTAQDGAYLDNSTEAFRAYNCMDYPVDCAPSSSRPTPRRCWRAEAPTVAPYWFAPDPLRGLAVPGDRRPRAHHRRGRGARSSSWARRTIPRPRTSGRCRWPSSCRRASW